MHTADDFIEHLAPEQHVEGGYYRSSYRSAQRRLIRLGHYGAASIFYCARVKFPTFTA